MARRRVVEAPLDEHDDVVRYYQRRLRAKAEPPKTKWRPVTIGPTWQLDGDRWHLPELSLGWDALGWTGCNYQHRPGEPWKFTDEQARLLLWWYAVDEDGRWLFNDMVLQRLKGWGKDPFGACWTGIELLGPCRFSGEFAPSGPLKGQPLGADVPDAWVQTAAVSLEQTKNTTRLYPGLFTKECRRRYGMPVLGKELIYAMGDQRLLQAVTSSPATLEGARSTAILKNETHHWTSSNEGHEMADVIERNATKMSGARTMAITNAYEPGEDSVGQRDREAHESIEAGRSVDTGLLYDSLEAPPDAPLTAEDAPAVVEAIRGDSVWLDVDAIVRSILDSRNPPSRSRRFWYNQITATEDAWISPQEWDALVLEVVVSDGETVTLGFDGSRTDDHASLQGCVVETGHHFEVKVWEPDKATGEVDRADIDLQVRQAFDRWDVVGFYSDLYPWESYVDTWGQDLGAALVVSSTPKHPIAWDMRSRGKEFTQAAERMHSAIVDQALSHDGATRTRQHFHNARRAPNAWGISVRKEHRESARKIDSVPAAVLARLARADYLALPAAKRKRKKAGGQVWGF